LLFMVSIPMIPVQLGRDFRDDILDRFDVDCLPLCDVACPREDGKWPCAWVTEEDDPDLKCLNAPDCCAVAECPEEREFPACASEPFNFKSSTREIGYWFRVWAPNANCFLLHSDFFLLTWVKQLGTVEQKLDFPGDECSEPEFDKDARWRFCAKQNLLLLSPWIILLIFAFIFLTGFIVLAWTLVKAIAKLISRLSKIVTLAATGAAATAIATTVTKTPKAGANMAWMRKRIGEYDIIGRTRTRGVLKKE